MIDRKRKFLIVGLGLIGGSYAEGLSKEGYYVGALDIDKDSLDYALEKGFIKEGFLEPSEKLSEYDIVILGLYPSLIVDWVKENQRYLKPGALLTDVAGIKGYFVHTLQSLLREDLEYIGAHPMAGRELSGVRNANAKIFQNANYIVTPTEKNSEKAIEICMDLGKLLGFSNIVTLTPERHDEMIAYLSQLTHAIAVSLMVCKDNESFAQYSGDSFRDLTRIANINDALWSELFLHNKEALLESMDAFIDNMGKMREMIKNEDVDVLRENMRLSKQRRSLFEKKEK